MLIGYTLRLTNNSITFLSTFLDKGKDNIWIKEIIDILYKIRWGWRAKDSGQWSNPSWPQHRPQLATTPTPAGPSPFPSPAGRGVICEVTPIGLLTWVVEKFFSHGRCLYFSRRKSCSHTEDVFFSHRTHRFNRIFLRTVSSPQNASGIQNSQNVTAKDGCKVLCNRLTQCLCEMLCVLFICVICEKKNICETCWGVFLSQNSQI